MYSTPIDQIDFVILTLCDCGPCRSYSGFLNQSEDDYNKTRVLLCKRLSGQCRDVYMVVYFHLHWWWWAVVDCAVLYWAVLVCTGLYWSVLG